MFNPFSQLPYELQSQIYSEYDLIASRKINKLTLDITKQSFLNKICNKSITKQEVNDYMTNLPDHIYFFFEDNARTWPL